MNGIYAQMFEEYADIINAMQREFGEDVYMDYLREINLEHMYSRNYQAVKNHYYLIQIGHMISQIMEAWEKVWKGINQSREQKHRRMLESFKETRLKEKTGELKKRFQIRFI